MGNWFCKAKRWKILMLGLDAAGKTTLLYHMKLGQVACTIPTIGFNVESIHLDGIELSCWDVGSRDKSRTLWKHYIPNTQGFMYIIDSTDRDRLNEAIEELSRYVLYYSGYLPDENTESVVMIVANKQDVEGALSAQEIEDVVLNRCSLRHHNKHTVLVVPCSAIDGKQVTEVFSNFAHLVYLSEAGKLKRGLISLKEQQAQKSENGKSAESELTFKSILKDPGHYLMTLFE